MPIGIYKRTTYNPGMFRKGKEHRNWKGNRLGYNGVHGRIQKKYGKAIYCQNRYRQILKFKCTGKSNIFDYAKRKGYKYTINIKKYYQLCRNCHIKYDKNWIKKYEKNKY